jgi:hypothetical protein
VGVVAAVADDLGVEFVEEGVEGGAVLRERLVEQGTEGLGGGGDEDGAVGEGVVVGGDAVESGASEGEDPVVGDGEPVVVAHTFRVTRLARRLNFLYTVRGSRELYVVKGKWAL